MRVVETSYKQGLNEIGQSMPILFSFARKVNKVTYTNSHSWVICRDFFGDVLSAIEDNVTKSIYNFSFNPAKQKIIRNKTCFIMKLLTMEQLENFKRNLPMLHELESIAKVKKTTYEVDGLHVVISGSILWSRSCANISLYTFLVKCLCYDLTKGNNLIEKICAVRVQKKRWDGSVSTIKTTECEYAEQVGHSLLISYLKHLKTLSRNLPTVSGWCKGAAIQTVHNYSGFVAVLARRRTVIGERFTQILGY